MLQGWCGNDRTKIGGCCRAGVVTIGLRLVGVAQCGCGNDSTKIGGCSHSVGVVMIVLRLVGVRTVWVW